jgi:hypothetical protein
MNAAQGPRQPVRGSLADSARTLWLTAPVWRGVVIMACCLMAFAIAAQILATRPGLSALPAQTVATANAARVAESWDSCAVHNWSVLSPDGAGRVARILSVEEATSSLRADEIRFKADIVAKYLVFTRVVVERDIGGHQSSTSIIVVPWDTLVRVGDTVEYSGAHTDPDMQCHYVPSLITRVIAADGGNAAARN